MSQAIEAELENARPPYDPEVVAAAKKALGIDRLVLQIHDGSFPGNLEEDIGRGSPYSLGAERFFGFAAGLGFDAVQLGPQGTTGAGNRSPYDGSLFSRNPMNLPLARLVEQGRLPRATLQRLRSECPADSSGGVAYRRLHRTYRKVAEEIASAASEADRRAARRYREVHESWLIPDALYPVLCEEHGAEWWGAWHSTAQGRFDQRLFRPPAGQEHAASARLADLIGRWSRWIEDYALVQWILDTEHMALRERLSRIGLALFGDLQVGPSQQDAWAWRSLFLEGYRMGAPPSRTNREGQPWGYRVLDPRRYGTIEQPGPALVFVQRRLSRLLAEFDGLRLDHPHGWIDPWVYVADDPDPFHGVQHGARLFSSPGEADHPNLHDLAIARPGQIDRRHPRHSDEWVSDLDEEQAARYGILVDAIVGQATAGGRRVGDLACEVLSTQPYPVRRVLARHGLGRFRVVQKADLDDPLDVYRLENAVPEDWVMLGTHDTPSVWELARRWCRDGRGTQWARYVTPMLAAESGQRSLAAQVSSDPGKLVHALFTAALAGRARHVLVFFGDLFGIAERYNEPGVVSDANWSLRLPHDFELLYEERVRHAEALDVGRCLAQALQSRAAGFLGR